MCAMQYSERRRGRSERGVPHGGPVIGPVATRFRDRLLAIVKVRFYRDTRTGLSHLVAHGVSEEEAESILRHATEDRPGQDGARIAVGQTEEGRYIRVIYVPDPEPDSVFVATAYELAGRPLAAYKRRRRKKQA